MREIDDSDVSLCAVAGSYRNFVESDRLEYLLLAMHGQHMLINPHRPAL